MIYRETSRKTMIREAERELNNFKRGIENGFWAGQGYSEEQIKNKLNFYEKDLAYTKKEISFEEYQLAVVKTRNERVV